MCCHYRLDIFDPESPENEVTLKYFATVSRVTVAEGILFFCDKIFNFFTPKKRKEKKLGDVRMENEIDGF